MNYHYVWYAVGLIIILLVVWMIGKSNQLSRYQVVIEESKKNVDTIMEMLKIAKSYAQHEEKVFVNLVKLRQGASFAETNEALQSQDQVLKQIFAVGENYPQMLSSQQFLNLQDEISKENDQLAASKRIVNSNISMINQVIVTFPSSFVASLKGLKQMEFLKEEDVEKKKSINEFDYHV